jgi:uncharacterized membrane protein
MSEDNKDLGDELNDMIGDAKDGAKRAGDKISQKASDLAGDAKKAASEFADDAKDVLSDGKNVGIIAHIWWIGWIIAVVMNNGNKTDLGTFYTRQTLGLLLLSLANYLVYFVSPMLGGIIALLLLVLWIMSLIGSLSGEKKPVFLLGEQFQEWFKSI